MMPAIGRPDPEREQNRERVEVHRAPEHERPDEVSLDVVDHAR